MIRVILESPFAGDTATNLRYLHACMRDCLSRGEAPFASHGLYPAVLDDTVPEERQRGMAAGFAWIPVANKTVAYTDLGVSGGMRAGIDQATRWNVPIEYRQLGGEWAR